ncbi:MAG: transporter [Mycobacterium sp.]|nr:transporter [Mycobacterium sp.]
MTYFVFLLLGLGNGAAFAALALALVVTFRSSGVVNFATGAIALYTAYTYAFLRQGQLLDPFPGLPVKVDLGNELDLVPALLVALLIAAVLGVVLYLLVFRPLRKAPPVAKAVASLGLMIIIQADVATRVGTSPVSVDAIFPTGTVSIGSSAVPTDRLWFAATIVAITIALSALFRFTRFGLTTRAAAESERGALVSGLSPERIAVVNWALSAVVAGLSGILIAPIVPLIPVSYTLFIVPALAAALVGGFTSVGPAVGAGLVIGMLQSEMTYLQTDHPSLPQSGLPELVPLVIILGYLVLRGRPLPTRGAIVTATLGRAPRPRNLLVNGGVGIALAVVGLLATSGSYRAAVITSLMLAVICLSLVVVTGFAGQISLAQLTLAGVAAFTLSRLTHSAGVPFPIAPLLAALAATVVGVVIGLPALRIRGLPVAVVTLALAVAVEQLWFNNTDFNGGVKGAPIKNPRLFGLDLGIGSGNDFPRISFGLMVLVVVALVAFGVAKLRTSRLGAAMLAVRANERSAAAAGIDVARTKIVAFAIGSFIAGLGGSLIGYSQGLASASSYSAIGGLALFATAYMAGITALSGGLLGGVIASGGILFIALDRAISLGSWYDTITGIGLVLTVILNPEGIVGPFHELAEKLRTRRSGVGDRVPAPRLDDELTPQPARIDVRRKLGEVQLALRGVSVRYGGVVANDDVSFEVRKGEIVGLIGPNGAGKTTLIDAISGYTPCTGSVELFSQVVDGQKPYQRIRRGLGRTFQGIELYEDLSVEENVSVGQTAARHGGLHVEDDFAPRDEDTLDRLFTVLKLDEVRGRAVRELSQGHRQLVSIARALAGRPSIVLLDEPAGGLDSTESRWLGQRLRAIRDAGVTIVMVDHDMGLVLDVCDRIVVLDLGCVIADGPPDVIQADPAVARAYLGTTHAHHAQASA